MYNYVVIFCDWPMYENEIRLWRITENAETNLYHKFYIFIDSDRRTSQWRHNERDGVSNHLRLDRLLKCLWRRSKRTSSRITGLCAGNPPVTGGFPSQRASCAENVSIWWRHHGGFIDTRTIIETFSASTGSTLVQVMAWCIKPFTMDSTHKGPLMWNFDLFFVITMKNLLNKQSSCQWFETPWCPYDVRVIHLLAVG